ncbi:hypothetical protein [Gracilimonas mengyeensis]|uniref:Outer membrane protein beta-barrel domain-containing protein n=1 Tax=Gracilimonas mengyeensis TaxID=1302730 RepID=A0A521E5B5_9BACT|nr:hypothetical protein [Gracilimonas mengyeensis]SMO79052.1 hypothetical protein SAMN06265219_110155 [Gracilimonas mengyeensis]
MKKLIFISLVFTLLLSGEQVFAQFGEPDVQEKENPRSLYDEGYRTGFGFNPFLNDFGFGAGGQFRFGLNQYTEAIATLRISALKDPTEQTFIDFLGYRTIPDKYQRVVSVPLFIGLKQRFFAQQISDNFRVFGTISGGPVFAWSYAYFNDANNNQFRENDRFLYRNYIEPVYDVFSGWKESKTHWGYGGEVGIGIDFGDNFANLSTVQFGYTMNYFAKGIQVLQPREADLTPGGQPQYDDNDNLITVEANGRRSYFGTAQISFVFGWMW